MAVLQSTNLTLADWASRVDPQGKMMVITELLNSDDTLLDDVVWKQANGVQKHVDSVRTGLPEVYFRTINAGVPSSKSATAKVEEVMSAIESRSEVDVRLIKLNGSNPNFRVSEDLAFIEAMKQKMFRNIIYGDPRVDPENFVGLSMRYNDPNARSASMVINADTSASAASPSEYGSVYMVTWGDNTCCGIFPLGSQVGLQHEDMGEDWATDPNGNRYRAMTSLFTWDAGLLVKDWESVGRIANISVPKLRDSSIDLVKSLVMLTERVEHQSRGRPVIYVPKAVRTWLRLQILAKNNVNLTFDTVEGRRVLAFDGIEVKALKGLTFAEPAYVSAT